MKSVMFKKSVVYATLLAAAMASGQASAAAISLSNSDFESGLTGWNTIGAVATTPSTTVTTHDNIVWTIGAAGSAMAQLQSSGSTIGSIESILGLAAGSLNALNTNANDGDLTNGSALYRAFSASAGDSISFAWDYVATDYIPFNDPAFALLIGPDASIEVLASIHGLGMAVGTSGHSGWQTFSETLDVTGDYTIAFVTTNDKDTVLNSHLFIDNVAGSCNPTCPPPVNNVPEPGSMALAGLALAGFAATRRRKSV
jgi:hypothetical protein